MNDYWEDFWLFFKEYWTDFFMYFVPIMLGVVCIIFVCAVLICEALKFV